MAAKQQELTAFAQAQGLDTQNEAIAAAIREVNYAALVAEAVKKNQKSEGKPTVASFAMSGGMHMGCEYDDLLSKG